MSSAQEIISLVHKIRAELDTPLVRNSETSGWIGFCGVADEVAYRVNGLTLRSPTHESPPGSYPGHHLALVAGEHEPERFIVDFTVDPPILAVIKNGLNESEVAKALYEATGTNDWRIIEDYSNRFAAPIYQPNYLRT
jgi:hypothetical protein